MSLAARIPAREYETATYAADSWVATIDFCVERYGSGVFYGGDESDRFISDDDDVNLVLNVPLCVGCDQPIVNHKCDFCEQVFLGEPLV